MFTYPIKGYLNVLHPRRLRSQKIELHPKEMLLLVTGWVKKIREGTEEGQSAARVSDMFTRETRGVSFHVLINSRVITGKLIPQSLSSFNEANYERHKCKHFNSFIHRHTRVQNSALRRRRRRASSLSTCTANSRHFLLIGTQCSPLLNHLFPYFIFRMVWLWRCCTLYWTWSQEVN